MKLNPLVVVIGALILLGVGAGGGILAYTWLVGGSGEVSAPIAAPTLSLEEEPVEENPEVAQLSTEVAMLRTQVAEQDIATAATEEAPAPAATEEALESDTATAEAETPVTEEATSEAVAAGGEATASRSLFRIVPEESEVRFVLQEDLFGERIDVIGTTNQVAGDIIVNFSNPAGSEVGTVRINMRSLTTDNEFRTRALRAEILQSAQPEYEFSDFVPTEIIGLPETAAVGDTIEFQITGDLTIAGVTQPVIFDTTVNVTAEDQLEGTATAEVLYSDFNISIPSAPGVSNITDEVTLQIDFVATLVDSTEA